MRFNFLFGIPFVVLVVIFGFQSYVLQKEQQQIKTVTEHIGQVTEHLCIAEQRLATVTVSGLKNSASVEQHIKLPPVEGNAKAARAHALEQQAKAVEQVSSTLLDCHK